MARGATFNALKNRETGATIVADDDDNEFANILDNLDPSGIGSYVASTAEHNATSDPFSGNANQIPDDLETRLQQICYLIKQISGKSNWVNDSAAFGSKGADVASANALVLGTDGNYFDITGTTAILSIGTLGVGALVGLHFDGILTLTHHATNLILPGGINITTAAGDEAVFREYATGDWRCIWYSKVSGLAVAPSLGYLVRAKFLWKDVDEIYIDPGIYHHSGTTTQFVSWGSQITFQLGSGGSNASSTDLGNNEFHYIYIDDSAVVTLGSGTLTASEFLNSTTAPTWNATKYGWYNGSDRCIFAIRTDGSAQILEFFHCSNHCYYADRIADRVGADLDTTWIDVTLTIPGFTQLGIVVFTGEYIDGATDAYWRTNGQTGTSGHLMYEVSINNRSPRNTVTVHTDSTQIIEVKHGTSNGNKCTVDTDGWLFPTGM